MYFYEIKNEILNHEGDFARGFKILAKNSKKFSSCGHDLDKVIQVLKTCKTPIEIIHYCFKKPLGS